MTSTSASSIILQVAAQYSFYSNCVLCTVGTIGNVLNILVFTRLKLFRENRCILYLTVEAIFNFINQLTSFIVAMNPLIYGGDTSYSLTWCKLRYIIFQSTSSIISSMICLAAFDQFCSTHYQVFLRQMCTMKLAQCLVAGNLIVCFVHSLLFIFFVDIIPSVGCSVINPIWAQYATYFFYPVLAGFLPIFVASLFSLLAYQNVRRVVRRQIPLERRRFDRQITAMVLVRVVFYVVFSLPFTIYRVYAINISTSQLSSLRVAIERLVQAISYSLSGLNSAMNFYIFIASSGRYRRQVKYILKKKYWQYMKMFFSRNRNQIHPDITTVSDGNIELE